MVFFYMVLLEYHVVGLVWCGVVIVSRVKILGSIFFGQGILVVLCTVVVVVVVVLVDCYSVL
jgi:hypothetical protein